ncbi:hypothetical protein NIES4075_70430 [Tolypothrix sp. NIES-4075]|nr:hypothetical protein NIES4075_70430 [Tolypothrix sp. NIES-4075]
MGNGEWVMGNGERGKAHVPNYQLPFSPLPIINFQNF